MRQELLSPSLQVHPVIQARPPDLWLRRLVVSQSPVDQFKNFGDRARRLDEPKLRQRKIDDLLLLLRQSRLPLIGSELAHQGVRALPNANDFHAPVGRGQGVFFLLGYVPHPLASFADRVGGQRIDQ